MQITLEYGLQTTQHEIAPCGGVDEKTQVQRHQEFGERISVDARVNRSDPQEAVRV